MKNSTGLNIPFSAVGKLAKSRLFRFRIYNEKSLVLLLLLISTITIFVILMKLPPDIQRAVNRDVNEVFLPPADHHLAEIHNDQHQHPAPPILKDDDHINRDKSQHLNQNEAKDENKIADSANDLFNYKTVSEKREKVKKMTIFAWSNYEKYAWGENELRPLSKIGHSAGIFGSQSTKLGATIVDGLDTLYLMGFMDEFKRGREWILNNLDLNLNTDVSAFEINIRFIGGLLSLYTLTNDKEFLKKAETIATYLLPIFDTPTGIPYALINPQTKSCKNYNWASGQCSILAEFGTLSLEFQYLSDLTNNPIFSNKIKKIYEILDKVEKENGIYYNYLSPVNAKWCMKHASIGALGDSFYEYLLKLWLYENKKDDSLLNTFTKSIKAIKDSLVAVSQNDHLLYIGELKSGRFDKKMDHLACFSGGLFALASISVNNGISDQELKEYLDIGKNITNTCHESYKRTGTGLGPESFHFERANEEAYSIKSNEKYYILRPEVVESYFYLWRVTKDPKYREWAWDVVKALETHCRTENGYSGVKDVYNSNSIKDDVQQSFFFAETLKYLFLIFSDDDVLPLDKYVFNSEAHPFLIKK